MPVLTTVNDLRQLREMSMDARCDANTRIRAYKLVDKDGWSPFVKSGNWLSVEEYAQAYQPIQYIPGQECSVTHVDRNPTNSCGAGINLATLHWCMIYSANRIRILQVEFQLKDLVAIPYFDDGKFRVSRCMVLKPSWWSKLVKKVAPILNMKIF